MGDFNAALLLFALVFAIPLLGILRKDGSLVLAYWVSLLPFFTIALVNAFLFTTASGAADAERFLHEATTLAGSGSFHSSFGGAVYVQFLALMFSVFGKSHFLAELLSVLAFALSSLVLSKFSVLLGFRQHKIGIMLLHAALPTMWMFGAVTMRESFEILFFITAAYSFVQLHQTGQMRWIIVALLSSTALGSLHNGLAAYALGMMTLGALWSPMSNNDHRRRWMSWMIAGGLLTITIGGIIILISKPSLVGSAALQMLLKGQALEYAQDYREGANLTRASYGVTLDTTSLVGFIRSLALLTVYYFLAPFPWQIRSPVDLYAASESLWRVTLIFFTFRYWQKSSGPAHRAASFLIILYFSMGFLWAMGTLNYGTSIRHNMVHYWIVVLLGGPEFLRRAQALLAFTVLPLPMQDQPRRHGPTDVRTPG